MSLPTLQSVFSSLQIDMLYQWIQNIFASKIIKGTVTMSAGVAVVSTEAAHTSSVISALPAFSPAGRFYYTINDGVSLTITSTSGSDSGTISYTINN